MAGATIPWVEIFPALAARLTDLTIRPTSGAPMHERRQTLPDPKCEECATRSSSVFSDIVHPELQVLSSSKTCRTHNKGDAIFYTGDRPGGLHCIHQGKVKICKTGPDGREQIIRLIGPGDIMGYRSLLGGGTYSSFAVALEECRICFIPRSEFTSLISSQAGLSMRMMGLLSDELKATEHRMVDLAQKSSRQRLAEALLLLKTKFGLEADGQTLAVKLSREEIAGVVGAAVENVIRLLSEFRREGLIELDRRNIRLLEESRLLDVADLDD